MLSTCLSGLRRNRKLPLNGVDKTEAFRTVIPAKPAAANEALEQIIFHVRSSQNFLDFAMAVNILKPVRVHPRLWDGHTMQLSIAIRETPNLFLDKAGRP